MDDLRLLFHRHPGMMGRLTAVVIGPDAYDALVEEHGLAHLTALADEYGVELVRAEEPLRETRAREASDRHADWYNEQIASMTDLPF